MGRAHVFCRFASELHIYLASEKKPMRAHLISRKRQFSRGNARIRIMMGCGESGFQHRREDRTSPGLAWIPSEEGYGPAEILASQ
jgi:hypothetical protein